MAKRRLDAHARVAINKCMGNVAEAMRCRVDIMIAEGRSVEEIQKFLCRLEIGIRTDSVLYSKSKRKKNRDVHTAEEIRTMVRLHIDTWFLPEVLPVKREQFCMVIDRILENEDIIKFLEPKKSRVSRDFHVTNLYNIIYEMAVCLEAFGTKEEYLCINKAGLIRNAFERGTILNNYTKGLNTAPVDHIRNIVKNCCY